ncbi:MAG: hypothetical protein L3J63_06855 [Geopsychrobacter sp.]|nr:hypothetical protein [Geopsychrobacter sp.]
MTTPDLDTALQQREVELQAAVDDALATATRKPTGKNRTALKRAQAELREFRDNLLDNGDYHYQSIPQMVEYLAEQGWRIGTSTAYEHRDQGKLKLRKNGSISQSEALEYARLHLKRKDGSAAETSLQEEKLLKDIARIDFDGRMRELKYRQALGDLIERNQVEIELADRATNLKNYFNAIARKSAGRMCKIVGGDPQKVPDLIEFILGVNRRAFDSYSRPIQGIEEED